MVKTVEPLRPVINSSMVRMWCFSRGTALLASRISMHKRVSPGFFLGTTTIGLMQGVWPSRLCRGLAVVLVRGPCV